MKSTFFSLICILLWQCSIAQRETQSGYVVTNNGDTVRGQIVLKDWNRNLSSISFNNGTDRKYSIAELQAFGNDAGSVQYKRFDITLHLNPNNESARYILPEDSTMKETQWLELLVPGKYPLYRYTNNRREYFFFGNAKDAAAELEYSNGIKSFYGEQFKNDPRYTKDLVTENPVFRSQLQALVNGSTDEKLGAMSVTVEYTAASLTRFFERLNTTERKDKSKMLYHFGVGAGIVITQNARTSNQEPFADVDFTSAISPMGRLFLHIKSSNVKKHISALAELMYFQINTKGNKPPEQFSNFTRQKSFVFNNSYLGLLMNLRYTFNPMAATKLYGLLGYSLNFKLSGTNYQETKSNGNSPFSSQETITGIRSLLAIPNAGVGVEVSRFSVQAGYFPPVNMTSYLGSNWKSGRACLSVGYRF